MARDVEADVNINDKSSRGLKSFLDNLRRADDSVKSTQKDLDKATSSTSKFGKSADENSKAVAKLHNEIDIAKNELGHLARAFADTDDAAQRIDLSKAIRKGEADIRRLTKSKGLLEDLIPKPDDPALKNFFSSISTSFEDIAANSGPILAAGIAAAAPLIGATVSAAVIGGAGLGGVIGGVLLAAKDARVQAAGKLLGTNIMGSLENDATVFIGPVLDAITEIGKRFDADAGRFKSIFSDASKFVAPLTDATLDFLDGILRGVDALVANAGPVIDALGKGLSELGNTIGNDFEEIGSQSQGAADGLQDVFTALNDILTVLGPIFVGLTWIYQKLHDAGVAQSVFAGLAGPIGQVADLVEKVTGNSSDLAKTQPETNSTITDFQHALAGATTSATSASDSIQTFTDKVDALATAGQGLYSSTTNVGDAIATFNKSLKDNGKTLSENTTKGRANRTALSNLAGALTSNYDAFVKVNGEGVKSNDVMIQNRNTFIKAAEAAGVSKTAAGKLATQLGLIPDQKTIKIKAETAQADAAIKALKAKWDGVQSKTVTIEAYVIAQQSAKSANTLDRFGVGGFSAAAYMAGSSGNDRTGGATPAKVDVANTVNVLLDGTPVKSIVRSEIKSYDRKAAWNQRTGRR